jgi:sugar O-acyltransferase (sialic acid O-acetyltransferase NeuD family)
MAEGRRFVCCGASGHAQVLHDMLQSSGDTFAAFIDKAPQADSFLGHPIFASFDAFQAWWQQQPDRFGFSAVFAIGRQGGHRLDALSRLNAMGIFAPTLISGQASVSAGTVIGAGSQVLPMAVVASSAQLGQVCIINHGAVVDHECLLGDGVHVAPRATLCGQVEVGTDVFVGAGAVVLPRLKLGDRAMIGAGAVVTHDILADTKVVGNPARVYRSKHEHS